MAKFKKTNDVSGTGRKANNYEAHNTNKQASSKKTSYSGETSHKNVHKATHENHTSSTTTNDVSRKIKTNNVQTSSNIQESATSRIHENTSSYSSNRFVESESTSHYERKPDISSSYSNKNDYSYGRPGGYVGTSSHVNSSFIASKPAVGKTHTSMNEDSLKNALGAMNYDVNRKTGTSHVQTASQAQVMAAMRTISSTNSYNSNHISSGYQPRLNSKVGGFDAVRNSYENNWKTSDSANFISAPRMSVYGDVSTNVSLNKEELAVFSKFAQKNGMTFETVQEGSNTQIFIKPSEIGKLKAVTSQIVTSNNKASIVDKLNKATSALGSIKNGTVSALGQVSKLSSSDDMGTAAVGSVASAAVLGIKGFETAQRVSELGIKGGAATAKGAYAVGDFAVKGVKTLDSFVGIARVTPLSNNAFQVLKSQALSTGLNQTQIAKGLLQGTQNAKTLLNHGVNGAQTIIHASLKTGRQIIVAGKVTRNVFAGAYSAKQIVHAAGYGIGKGAAAIGYGAKTLGINGIKAAAKGVRWTFVKAFPKTFKFLGKGSIGTWRFGAKALMGSGDLGLQSVGTAMEASYQAVNVSVKTVKATAKTIQTGGKTIVYAGKGAYRAGKGIVHGVKFIKNNGLKAAWNKARNKAAKAAAEGIKGVANALLEIIKRLGMKLVVPLALIIVVAIGFNLITTPVMAVAGVFGGVFNDDDTGDEINIDEYLHDSTKGVPAKTEAIKNDIVDKLVNAESSYDIVRFRANTSEGEGGLVVEHTYDAVNSVFPSDEEIIEMVKPLFQAVILMNYDNSPSDTECQDLLNHIMDTMFTVVQEDTTEYCGQDIVTGEGEIDYCSSCGAIHAHDDCPNPLPIAYHSSYTCDLCCYYYCPGHEHVNGDGTRTTTYCSGCTHACNGHIDCGGHAVTTFTLNCDGIYSLVQEYFLDPIDALESTSPRSDDEEKQLSLLKSYYEIFEEMAKLVSIGGYSGGLTVEDLSGVHWVNGSRTGCDAIIEYAKQYLGNTGGQTFWSYLGFRSRVSWCACYVYYIMQNSGYGGSYPSSSNYAYCPTMASAFSAAGRFANSDFRDIVAGDVIYFDYKHEGETHHTGLVIGRDDTKVYTIEGNSGDKVKIKSYDLNSSVIYGYGLMNY